MRRASKKDDNHDEITGPLKKIGFSIFDTYQLGSDAPDFVCAFIGITGIVEVKNRKTRGKLTEGQKKFKQQWNGLHIVAYDYRDVLKAFGVSFI